MTGDDDRHAGDRPHPNDRPCDDCGHIWFPGERRHDYVDDAERSEDVEVLCTLCRQQRRLRPAEK